jgi:hypothetical protein
VEVVTVVPELVPGLALPHKRRVPTPGRYQPFQATNLSRELVFGGTGNIVIENVGVLTIVLLLNDFN